MLPWFFSQPNFHLKYLILNISSDNVQHVKPKELKKLVIMELNGTALTTDLGPIYKSVLSHPWIKEATVRRIWPNKILVNLVEHNIIGVWSDGRFVTQAGKLLQFDKLQSESINKEKNCFLLKLDGPNETVTAVLDRARMISKKAIKVGLQTTGVQLTNQYDWRVFFSNGMKMELGGENLETPLEKRLDNFFNSIAWVRKKIKKDLISVDLRYAQGFAFEESKISSIKTTRSINNQSNLKNCIDNKVSEKVVL
tara:strand:+ start:1530 stop:2288 length:759 start_codon:yes stop_codon:yes gene_type:complete